MAGLSQPMPFGEIKIIPIFGTAQNGGKMGFLKPNLVENARQMGEIALKNDFQLSWKRPQRCPKTRKNGLFWAQMGEIALNLYTF